MLKYRLFANPLKNIEATRPVHFQIQENHAGHWIQGPIGVFAIASQIIKGLFATVQRDQRQVNARLLPGALKKKTIILAIIDVQNTSLFCAVHI